MLERFKGKTLNCLLATALSGFLLNGCSEFKPQSAPQARSTFGFSKTEDQFFGQFNLRFDPKLLDGVTHYTDKFNSHGHIADIDLVRNDRLSIFEVAIADSRSNRINDRIRFNTGNYKTNLTHTLTIRWKDIINKVFWDNQSIPFSRLPADNPN